MTVVRAAAAHLAPVFMDTDATVDKAVEWIRRAGAEGVELLVFPEVFVPGYPYWIECYPPLDQVAANAKYIQASIEVPGPEIARVQAAARDAGVVVSLGISERALGGSTCFNSMVTIDADGTVRGVHRKLQPTYAERYIWGQGDGSTLSVYDTQVGRLGGLACWEHTMNLARQALIVQGIQIHAGAWPGLSTMAGFMEVADAQIEAMMKTHALTAQCFVVTASNPVDQGCLDWMERELGPQKHVELAGGWSAVIHPFASFLGGPHTGLEEKLVIGDLDLDQITSVKVWVDAAGHYARPEILRLLVDTQPKWNAARPAQALGAPGVPLSGYAPATEVPPPPPEG